MMPALSGVADLFMTQAKEKASQEKAPSNIQDAFYADSPQQMGGIYFIDVHVDLKIAPAAAAYEWGSGIHATLTRGGKQPEEYPIPKKATGVAFPKDRWPRYQPPPGESIPDYFYFPQISHPGVAPRPYLTPTLQDHIDEYTARIGAGLVSQIILDSPREVVVEVRL